MPEFEKAGAKPVLSGGEGVAARPCREIPSGIGPDILGLSPWTPPRPFERGYR